MRLTRLVMSLLLACAGLGACSRGPQTAAELSAQLPKRFSGALHLPGEPDTQRITVESRGLAVRSAHVLEFHGIQVQLRDAQGGVTEDHAANVRGTISAPGLEIRLEQLGAAGGEDFIKSESFRGKLSSNLQAIEATWTTGFGGSGSLNLKADAP